MHIQMSSSLAAASCPPNSHYDVCANTCGVTCASFIYPYTCSESCFEGCQCDDSFVFDGTQCVSMDKCGCVHDGRYLKVKLSRDEKKMACHGIYR